MNGRPGPAVVASLLALTMIAGCGVSVEDVRADVRDRLCRNADTMGQVAIYERPPVVYAADATGELGFVVDGQIAELPVAQQHACNTVQIEGTLRRAKELAPEWYSEFSAWFLISTGPLEGWVNLTVPRELPIEQLPDAPPLASTGLPDLSFDIIPSSVGPGDPCTRIGETVRPRSSLAISNEGPGALTAPAIHIERFSRVGGGRMLQPGGPITFERLSSGPWTGAELMAALRAHVAEEYDADTLIWPSRAVVLSGRPLPDLEPDVLEQLVDLANSALDLVARNQALEFSARSDDPDVGYGSETWRRLERELDILVAQSNEMDQQRMEVALMRPLEPGESIPIQRLGVPPTLEVIDFDSTIAEADETNNFTWGTGTTGEEYVCL